MRLAPSRLATEVPSYLARPVPQRDVEQAGPHLVELAQRALPLVVELQAGEGAAAEHILGCQVGRLAERKRQSADILTRDTVPRSRSGRPAWTYLPDRVRHVDGIVGILGGSDVLDRI